MRRLAVILSALALALALPGSAAADHDPPGGVAPLPGQPVPVQGGGEWELLSTLFTGNPHTDLDFFTKDGETYASVGTLAIGGNRGGQTIVRLTDNGEVSADTVEYVSSHPSATCVSDPSRALGLQHDIEATPAGSEALQVPQNAPLTTRVEADAQLLLDATDHRGRCHDQGPLLGVDEAPLGGLEIIDIADVTNPKEIGLTVHIGEAHTVNVDPRRPHIAYAVTSDSVSVVDGVRQNEVPGGSQRFRLDGFEVVDLSSCMTEPYGTLPEDADLQEKRDSCRPEVYRYRYPTLDMSLGHHNRSAVYGCHELEVYPNDLLTCGSGAAMIVFDMSDAFDENGKPRGTPLTCEERASSNNGAALAYTTAAMVVDCAREGQGDDELSIPEWIEDGRPSLEGVKFVGTAHHQGRQATGGDFTSPAYESAEDIDFDHEAELTHSGKFVLATDERGGGVTPPGASCAPGIDNPVGNGGIHAYRIDQLDTSISGAPTNPERAWEAYALTPEGDKAVARAPINTQPQAATCTAHVFQQIPGQNRIFMGWYSQGTQVFDYRENPDGTFEFAHVGYFIPPNANQWVSHVFKMEPNDDGTITYYGVAGDFLITGAGRNAIDVWKATLPAVGSTFADADDGGGGGGGSDAVPGDGSGDDGAGDQAGGPVLPATGGPAVLIPAGIALLGLSAAIGRSRRRRREI